MSTIQRIIFRTDASTQIGSGHVMRCLALATSLREEAVEVSFVCRAHQGNLIRILRENGFIVHELPLDNSHNQNEPTKKNRVTVEDYIDWLGCTQVEDAQATLMVIGENRYDWLIVDHYALDECWESQLRQVADKLMVIDDLANRQHDCDLLLDQNYFAEAASRYESLIPASSLSFLGPEYALLRSEFAATRSQPRPRNSEIRRVFVFFGGTDPDNITGLALEALRDPVLLHLEVDVVLGAINPHQEKITAQIAQRPNTHLHVQVKNMAELMASADLALGAGGINIWERLCLGLPSLVVRIADNQRAFEDAPLSLDWVVDLGESCAVTSRLIRDALREQIEKWADKPRQLNTYPIVDGYGVGRVTEYLTKGIGSQAWELREAKGKDCLLYWQWANEAEVREQAFLQEIIPWENHLNWFQKRLKDKQTMLVLVTSKVGPIGQVRFEMTNQKATISYSLGRSMRGYGFGRTLLEKAIEYFRQTQSLDLYAEVKVTNCRSARVFENSGFEEIKETANRQEVRYFQKLE